MRRAELIKALGRIKIETGSIVCLGCGYEHNCCTQGCALIRAAAEELSAADVRPVVRGRWVKLYEDPLDGSFYCSNCKGEIDIADGGDTPLNRGLYYCHNCGADMRGSDVE